MIGKILILLTTLTTLTVAAMEPFWLNDDYDHFGIAGIGPNRIRFHRHHPAPPETLEWINEADNIYDPEPKDNEPLTKERVMNAYWQKIEGQNQKTKDAALRQVLNRTVSPYNYRIYRFHAANALYAGADANCEGSHGNILKYATIYNDYELCKLALEHGANPNQEWLNCPLIKRVKSCAMAELFIKHGADISNKTWHNEFWAAAASLDREPELISFWKMKGISVFATSNVAGISSLDWLAIRASEHTPEQILTKAYALFQGLTKEEICSLIKIPASNGDTPVRDLRNSSSEGARALLSLLNDYLKDEIKPAPAAAESERDSECPICSDNTTDRFTPCLHAFCKSCIEKWLQTKQTCPICRTLVIVEDLVEKQL